ncbi:MAG: hypothetical protein JWP11_48 [Frankiales bacterium]|nr:hypothetical protein [Frankiales bacterium]
MTTALTLAAHLLDATDPTSPVSGSPVGAIIAVTMSGVASIVVALTGYSKVRNRRQREADAEPALQSTDPEDRPSRLRERLTTLEAWSIDARAHNLPDRTTLAEARLTDMSRRISDLEEKMDLRRAADVVIESGQAPTRRRLPPRD